MRHFRKNIYRTGEDSITVYSYNFAIGQINVGLACEEIAFPVLLYSADSVIIIGSILYTDIGLITPYDGENKWFKMGTKTYQISNVGVVFDISIDCAGVLPVEEYCYKGLYDDDDPIHVPPGGVINYQDEFGNPQTETGLTTTTGITTIYSSTVPDIVVGAFQVDCETGEPI